MATNGNGRKPPTRPRLTPKQRRVFLEKLREGCTLESAAQAAGRQRKTFFLARQADEAFALEVAEAIEAGNDMVEQQLVDIAFGRVPIRGSAQVTACFGLLRARRPDVWRERHEVRHTGRVAHGLDLSKLSREQLELFKGLLELARADTG